MIDGTKDRHGSIDLAIDANQFCPKLFPSDLWLASIQTCLGKCKQLVTLMIQTKKKWDETVKGALNYGNIAL